MRSPGTGELFHSYLGTVSIFVPFLMVPIKSPLPHLAVWLKTELSDLAFFAQYAESLRRRPLLVRISLKEAVTRSHTLHMVLPFVPSLSSLAQVSPQF